jgi:hypothetical protein
VRNERVGDALTRLAAAGQISRRGDTWIEVSLSTVKALDQSDQFSATGRHIVAISPDGTRLAYGANNRLYLRELDRLDATPIPGTESGVFGRSPFFSPDGQWIGFY